METWVLLSIAAAAFQTLRFMLQKKLSMGALSTGGATFARFIYSAPFMLALALGYLASQGANFPALGVKFWAFALTGGLAQILATACVVSLFRERNFAVGITFKKTEVVQTAFVGLILLGEGVSIAALGAIFVGLLGVLLLSDPPEKTSGHRIFNRAAGIGLLSGAIFAISAVCYRGATLEIASDDAFLRASVALAMVTLSQTLAMALWLGAREKGEITRVLGAWRTAVWIGLSGLAGSLCWFTAFTLANAAYVFAVGQVEVIFSLAVSVLFFSEKFTRREMGGIILITLSVLSLILIL